MKKRRRLHLNAEEYDALLADSLKDKASIDENNQMLWDFFQYPHAGETEWRMKFYRLPGYRRLLKKYPLQEAAGDGDTLARALGVMHWLCSHTYYSGVACFLPDASLCILRHGYKKNFSHALNCRHRALVLADCLCALKIYAYPIMGISPDQKGCHFMLHVFLPERNKWVLLDPSFDTCFTSEEGTALHLFELRQALAEHRKVLMPGYQFNHSAQKHKAVYEAMFIPCMFYLTTWCDNRVKFGGFYNRRHLKLPKLLPCGAQPGGDSWFYKDCRLIGAEALLREPEGWVEG